MPALQTSESVRVDFAVVDVRDDAKVPDVPVLLHHLGELVHSKVHHLGGSGLGKLFGG
jgi:hypothetical protein